MLVTATSFFNVVLAIHILFVVSAFGVLIAFPLLASAAERIDPRAAPVFHRVRVVIGRTLVNPGLVIVLIAGIYLAAKVPNGFHDFYVQWGIAAIIVLGGLEGALIIRDSKKLAELGERDVQASAGAQVKWSGEYLAAKTRADRINGLAAVIVALTIIFMTFQS